MSMYVRVKRQKTTVFLEVSNLDSTLAMKKKLEPLLKVPADNMRLIYNSKPLEDNKTVADNKIQNDDVLALVFRDGDDWEEVNITPLSQPQHEARGDDTGDKK
eukprot:Colp12_sorted_trinity150504_noHs@3632